MTFLPQEIIKNKRDGKVLSKDEIDFFVQGIANDSVSDSQIAAFAMATYFQDMNDQERIDFTQSMVNSGDVLDWSDMNLNGPVLDKHSTGGVGDKISLMLAPIIAACGGYVPMISGRGLGHTGGTLDKFDAIPGYNTSPNNTLFRNTVKNVGCAIIGQTANLAPADKRFYATRDNTATVDCIPLITASILSKKLAEGLDGLVMDIKTGNGAFAANIKMAQDLARTIVNVSSVKTSAIITDMSQVIGSTAGNSLEVLETIEYLTCKHQDPILHGLVKTICAEMLVIGELSPNHKDAENIIETVLSNGEAAEVFSKMVSALGGPNDLLEKPDQYLAKANVTIPVYSQTTGYISKMDTRLIGLEVVRLGGGRKVATDSIDYSVGISNMLHIGDSVEKNQPIAFVHAKSESEAAKSADTLSQIIKVSESKPSENQLIIEKIQ